MDLNIICYKHNYLYEYTYNLFLNQIPFKVSVLKHNFVTQNQKYIPQ